MRLSLFPALGAVILLGLLLLFYTQCTVNWEGEVNDYITEDSR